jgi:tRNA 2-thiocytidine biosynthesis protein TtcA
LRKPAKSAAGKYRIEHTSIGDVMDDILDSGRDTLFALCPVAAWRAVSDRDEVGATKIALGHHLDDFIETLLLNLFFAGALKAMPARLVSDNGEHVVIRPFAYVGEDEARLYCKEVELPIIGCCCPACGDLSLQRQRVKRLIMDLEVEHPGVKQSMLKALGNVMPRHLLDTRSIRAGSSATALHCGSQKPPRASSFRSSRNHEAMRAVISV